MLQRIIINTGKGQGSANLDFSYSLELIKIILGNDKNTNKQIVTHRDDFGSTALEQALALNKKTQSDNDLLFEILDLLISNGANLKNISKDGSNIFHYITEFGDEMRIRYISNKIKDIYGIDTLKRIKNHKNHSGMTPETLALNLFNVYKNADDYNDSSNNKQNKQNKLKC